MDIPRALFDLIAPLRCTCCGVRSDAVWCRTCDRGAAAQLIREPCSQCAADHGNARHGCWPAGTPIASTTAVFTYHAEVATAIVAAKTRGAWRAWEPWGRRLAAAIVEQGNARAEAVTWVPSDRRRARARDGDHAQRLARAVADELGLPLVATLRARPGREDQATRAPELRGRLSADAFLPTRTLRSARLILVDDILTTGATAATAAATLVRAGTQRIDLAVLARAGDHRLVGGPS